MEDYYRYKKYKQKYKRELLIAGAAAVAPAPPIVEPAPAGSSDAPGSPGSSDSSPPSFFASAKHPVTSIESSDQAVGAPEEQQDTTDPGAAPGKSSRFSFPSAPTFNRPTVSGMKQGLSNFGSSISSAASTARQKASPLTKSASARKAQLARKSANLDEVNNIFNVINPDNERKFDPLTTALTKDDGDDLTKTQLKIDVITNDLLQRLIFLFGDSGFRTKYTTDPSYKRKVVDIIMQLSIVVEFFKKKLDASGIEAIKNSGNQLIVEKRGLELYSYSDVRMFKYLFNLTSTLANILSQLGSSFPQNLEAGLVPWQLAALTTKNASEESELVGTDLGEEEQPAPPLVVSDGTGS